MKTITFCFTSEKARELYNGKPPQYETPFASGFDLRAVEFDISKQGVYSFEQKDDYQIWRRVFNGKDDAGDIAFTSVTTFPNGVAKTIDDWVKELNHIFLRPKERILIKTGIRVAMPIMENEIMELQVRSRSGLALKNGICVLNGIGTIDNDYTGELGVILYNAGHEPFTINIGDRIAQGVFNPLQQCVWQEVSQEDFDENFCNTQRGSGGFGSTGK